jgi:hypothetical protein
MIYVTIRGFIRIVINGGPRLLLLNSLIWIVLGTICGAVGLGSGGSFFNPFTIVFLGWAAVEIALALFRSVLWRKEGLRRSLPDGTTFLRIDHILQVRERTRPLLGVRETTITYHKQLVPFTPPATESQPVSVRCSTCQQEMQFRVDSVQKRQAVRLRTAGIAALCFLIGLGLALLSNNSAQAQSPADWAYWVRLLALILLFCSLFATAYVLNYVGAVVKKAPIGHKVRQPEKVDYEQFRQMVSSASIEPMMHRPLPSQQGWR